jgi:Protein of unknown function with HXXEE motif
MRTTTKLSLGLFAAWALHDLEELATTRATSREILARVPSAVPLPAEWRRDGFSQRHVTVAIGVMGAVMATAAGLGVRSGGRSAYFRGTLLGFGLHGVGHIASSVALGRYTSGVATAPTVVIPYWLWARRRLAAEGIRDDDRPATVVALSGVPTLLVVHALVHVLLRRRRRG